MNDGKGGGKRTSFLGKALKETDAKTADLGFRAGDYRRQLFVVANQCDVL